MLETDDSGEAETERRIGSTNRFVSRTLQLHEQNDSITELEGLGVVLAMKHFKHYLYGHKCEVLTDHEALK